MDISELISRSIGGYTDKKDENIGKLRLEGYREALKAHGLEVRRMNGPC